MASIMLLTGLAVQRSKRNWEKVSLENELKDCELTITCRFCGDIAEFTLYSKDCSALRVRQMERFFKFKIRMGDQLPQKICKQCLTIWNNLVKYRRRCQLIHEVLQTIVMKRKKSQRKSIKYVKRRQISGEIKIDDLKSDSNVENSDSEIPISELVFQQDKTDEEKGSQHKPRRKCTTGEDLDAIPKEIEICDIKNTRSNSFIDCILCGGCFYDKPQFKNHQQKGGCTPRAEEKETKLKLAKEEKQIMCEVCGKIFKSNGQLKAHSEYHVEELCYMCEHCPYRGRTRALLVIHLRTHTGYKPHKCQICGKSFVNASNLNKHKWTHDNTRKYKCKECDKDFVCESYLKKHIYVNHSGNLRVHRCITCSKGFPNRYTLKKHRQKMHSELLGMGTATYLREDLRPKLKADKTANNSTVMNET